MSMDRLALIALALAKRGGGGSNINPYASNPAMIGTTSAGSSDDYARGDHVHDFNADFKAALLQIAAKVAYIDSDGQEYYDALEAALVHRTLSNITAVFTQGQTSVYPYTDIDTLKQYLVVTAHYSDNTDIVLGDNDYQLSGTLATGTSTITVTYHSLTTTFDVVVSADNRRIHIYHFNDSLASDGNVDFELSATTPSYTTGKIGKAIAIAAQTPANVPSSVSFSNDVKPVFDGDFTIAFWGKASGSASNTMFRLCEYRGTKRIPNSASLTGYNGHTGAYNTLSRGYTGVSGSITVAQSMFFPFFVFYTDTDTAYGFDCEAVSANQLALNVWHHFAVCRKNGVATLFVNGQKWFSMPLAGTIYVPNQILFGGSWDSTNTVAGITVPANVNPNIDEFYINDKQALYTDEFTPPTEPYSL